MNNQVDVSVAMMTFCHEKYIARALESVLAQKTDYSYEIVISDDCSVDKTRDILLEYQKNFPDIIRLNFNSENLGISNNNYKTRCLCRGRYIATLSGDDYWIDEFKLQNQVDYLDSHPEYYAVVTCIEERFDDDDHPFAVFPPKQYRGKTIDLEMYLHGATFGTNGMMMRNAYLSKEGKEYFSLVPEASPYIDDATECLLVLMKGKIYVADKRSVVYRVQRNLEGKNNFNSINTTIQKCKKSVDLYNNIYKRLEKCPDLFYLYKTHIAVGIAQLFLNFNFKEFNDMYKTVPKEYRRRGLLVRSIPNAVSACICKIKNLILARR